MILPDNSFLDGKARMFCYKDEQGKVDLQAVAEAIPQIIEADLPAPTKARLIEKARAILKRTTEAELQSYINRKGPDMASDIFSRIAESVVNVVYKRLWVQKLRVAGARQRLSLAPAEEEPTAPPEEKPVAEAMMESYALPAEALSEVAAFEEGKERVLHDCVFIRAGLNSPQTRRWPAELLESNVALFDNALCYIDHPSPGKARSLRSLAGHTSNPRFDKTTKSIIGDIVLLSNEAADYVVDVFGNKVIRDSGDVGLSVLFEPGRFDADFEEHGHRTIQVPTRLGPEKPTVDFVSNPTGYGLVGAL